MLGMQSTHAGDTITLISFLIKLRDRDILSRWSSDGRWRSPSCGSVLKSYGFSDVPSWVSFKQ